MSEWGILVSLCSEEDDDILVDSSLYTLSKEKSFYAWEDVLKLDGFRSNLYLSFQLILGRGRLEIFKVFIETSRLRIDGYFPLQRKLDRRKSVYANTEPLDLTKNILHLEEGVDINYACHMYNMMYQIRIYMVSVPLAMDRIESLMKERGDKIALYVNDQLYLGRPQMIRTDLKKGHRYYLWTQKNREKAPIRNYELQAEESKDLILLSTTHKNQAEALLSTRRIDHLSGVVWDNDAFSNPFERLPVMIRSLVLYVYNFRYLPPRSIKVNLPWGRFVTAYLQNMNRIETLKKSDFCKHHSLLPTPTLAQVTSMDVELGKNMQLRVTFSMEKSQQMVKLRGIRLFMENYEETLKNIYE